jgi:hypothetical protein
MEMKVMMPMWLAEMRRIHNKGGEYTPTEEFFIELTLEFDRARNGGAPGDRLNWLLTQIDLYLSGRQEQAMANVLTAAARGRTAA